jgi:hypothetical protein
LRIISRANPGLRLPDLTFDDTVAFISDKFQAHHKMLDLTRLDSMRASEMVKEIIIEANGVFLWVTTVVRSLFKGLRNGDGILDLRKRLKGLPANIGPFCTHMTDQIEPLYR